MSEPEISRVKYHSLIREIPWVEELFRRRQVWYNGLEVWEKKIVDAYELWYERRLLYGDTPDD